MPTFVIAAALFSSLMLVGCESKPPQSPPAGNSSLEKPAATATAKTEKADDHAGHDHAEGDQAHADGGEKSHAAGHGGEVVELGTTTIGELTVRASREKEGITPGGDAPIDVWLTTKDGKPATVSAVRFWIGLEDSKGSVKARAEIEDPKMPNHWHTHVEVPKPLLDGSKLWVEIETGAGKKAAGFDLQR